MGGPKAHGNSEPLNERYGLVTTIDFNRGRFDLDPQRGWATVDSA